MERFATILLAAGVGCFVLAGVVSGVLPVMHLRKVPVQSLEEIAPDPSEDFLELAARYPDQVKAAFGGTDAEAFRSALRLGRDTYIAEACWHCHSQFVRPVSAEDRRFGAVSWAAEYQNEMFLPHLFGTRRVGPDLIRQAGRHSVDWQVAHFFDPTIVVPSSVMPRYSWFFDGETPNARGLAMITYVQWLGSWATPEALARKAQEETHVE